MNAPFPASFLLSGLFGEQLIGAADSAPIMARIVAAVTPEVAKHHVRLVEEVSGLGFRLRHDHVEINQGLA